MDKILRLVRISLLIRAIQNGFAFFFSGKLFYKSNRKLFSCFCIAWYKHSRRRILPTLLVLISGYANTQNVFYCLNGTRGKTKICTKTISASAEKCSRCRGGGRGQKTKTWEDLLGMNAYEGDLMTVSVFVSWPPNPQANQRTLGVCQLVNANDILA